MSAEKFNPSQHLRNIKGKGGNAEYLDVKWRLVWLRSEHPNASTVIEHIEISPDIAIFRATVTIPDGGSATDYGSETPKDFGDFIEKAATKALGRALAQLGYGTQFVGEELDEGVRIVDSPVDRTQTTRDQSRPTPSASSQTSTSPAAAPVAAGPPYTDTEYDKVIDAAWQMAEDGETLDAIKGYINEHWARIPKPNRPAAVVQVDAIERKWYAPASQAG